MGAGASALTYFAADPGGGPAPCEQSDPCSLQDALTQAGLQNDNQLDTVQVLGALSEGARVTVGDFNDPVELVGSGTGAGGTELSNPAGSSLELKNADSIARNLRVTQSAFTAVTVDQGTLRDAVVDQQDSDARAIASSGIAAFTPAIESTTISSHGDLGLGAVDLLGAGTLTITDSTITSTTGPAVDVSNGTMIIQRSTLEATVGPAVNVDAKLTPPKAIVSDTVIRQNGGASAVLVNTDDDKGSDATLRQVTIDGRGSATNGVLVTDVDGGDSAGTASATIRDSIVWDFTSRELVTSPTLDVSIDVDRTNYAAAGGNVSFQPGLGGNVAVDPLFQNAGAGNYRLMAGSPMIDAGGIEPIALGESATDRDGNPRMIDSDGNDTAERDMGAFEFLGGRPETQIDSGVSGTTADNTPTFTFSSSSTFAADFQCALDGGPFGACSGAGTHTTAPLADGPHSFQVRARNAGGFPDETPALRSFQVDTAGPPAPTIVEVPGPTQTVNAPVDETAAGLALAKLPKRLPLRRFLRGFNVTVTPDEPVSLDIALTAKPRRVVLASGLGALVLFERSLPLAEGERSVAVAPRRGALRGVNRPIRVVLRIIATDTGGNRTVIRKRIVVRPPRR